MTGASGRLKRFLAVLFPGCVVAAFAWAWRFESTPPELAEDFAAAAGLRPPAGPLSLLWHSLAAPLFGALGVNRAETVLAVAGPVALGVLASLSAVLFSMLLPASLKRGERLAGWWRRTARFVLYAGVAYFCFSDPVWNAFRRFSPLALQLLLAVVAVMLFISHLLGGKIAPLVASFAVFGVLAADAPSAAFLLLAAIAVLCGRRRLRGAGLADPSAANPLVGLMMPLKMTLAFAAGAAACWAAEAWIFDRLDGLAAFGWTWGDYACKTPVAWIKAALSSCTPAGYAIFFSAVLFPFAIEASLVRRAADDEKILFYGQGAVFAGCGLIALSQLSGASDLWFWTWGGGCVRDGLFKCVASALSALTALWSLAVFAIELYLRSLRRVAVLRFPDALESSGAVSAIASAKRLKRNVRGWLLAVPLLALSCIAPFRRQGLEREMLSVVADAAAETAREAAETGRVFTDGGLDALVELSAAESGKGLFALSMMGGAGDKRGAYIRRRAARDDAERAVLESGAADALRTWVRGDGGKSHPFAVQIGFEMWRRVELDMPACSGLAAFPGGVAPEEASRGAGAARSIARRIIALYDKAAPDAIPDKALRDAFLFVQWRLAVIARHRSNEMDAKGDDAAALEDTQIADGLDRRNAALDRIRETLAWASRRKLEHMTPQEGLRLGLARADFALARVFAQRVLDVSPGDPEANFALGMDFFVHKQYARAEAHLAKCLEARPDDPAVLNNLAQCRLRRGDAKGAEAYAKRAAAILPSSPEIRRTLEKIAEAQR